MRRQRDPDSLKVRLLPNGRVFVSWNYDEGPSGTLTLSVEAAGRLGTDLECIKLLSEMEETDG